MTHLIHSPHFTVEETEAQVTCSQSPSGMGGTKNNVLGCNRALNADFTFKL